MTTTRHYIAVGFDGEHNVCSTREAAALTLFDRHAGRDTLNNVYWNLLEYGQWDVGGGHVATIEACDCNDPASHCKGESA